MLPVAVLVGGLGTRMAPLTGASVPKALLPVAGRPFLDYKLASLAAESVETVVLLIGYGGDQILKHVERMDSFGLRILVRYDGHELRGTGGAIRRSLDLLGEAFWVTYGDAYLRVDVKAAEARFAECETAGMMTVLKNRDAWDRSNVRIQGELVMEYRKGAPRGTFQHIDYGMTILSGSEVARYPSGEAFDLSAVFDSIIAARQMSAFEVTERFYEIGSPRGYRETEAFLRASREWERLIAASGGRS